MRQVITSIKDRIKGKVPLLSRRSSSWIKVRNAFLAKNNSCAACGSTNNLQVHHIIPFHVQRDLELVESNLITLCEGPGHGCHLGLGHNGNYRKFNPNITIDAANELNKKGG